VFGDLRVVSLARDISGAYCAKLLRDAGADVVLVEPPGGAPLRTWSAGGADLQGEDGALFRFLHGGLRSVIGDAGPWIAAADVVVCDELDALDVDTLRRDHPALVVVTITPWGWAGPWRDRPATEFTVQAAAGSSGQRGVPDRPPIAVGARLAQWIAGTYAGAGAAAAAYGARRHGRGEHVDVALLDCIAVTMTNFAPVFASFEGWPADPGPTRTAYIPGIEPTADGWVGVTAMTWQQLQDFFRMVERPDWAEDRTLATRPGREARQDEIMKSVRAWTRRHLTEEVIEQASAYRIPTVAITRPDAVPELEQLVVRGVFEPHPGADFVQPRPPYRVDGTRLTEAAPAPRLGVDAGRPWSPQAAPSSEPATTPALPLAGLKVADFTIFWAGPTCTQTLAAWGAVVF